MVIKSGDIVDVYVAGEPEPRRGVVLVGSGTDGCQYNDAAGDHIIPWIQVREVKEHREVKVRLEGDTLVLEQDDLDGLVSYLAKGIYFQKRGLVVKTVAFPMLKTVTARLADRTVSVATEFRPVPESESPAPDAPVAVKTEAPPPPVKDGETLVISATVTVPADEPPGEAVADSSLPPEPPKPRKRKVKAKKSRRKTGKGAKRA